MEETEPHPDSAALLTIDGQRDFAVPGGPAKVPGTVEAIPAMGQVALVTEGQPLVAPGTEGAELVDDNRPARGALRLRTLRAP